MIVGISVTVLVTVVGGLIGMVAGYFGGWIDALLSRVHRHLLRTARSCSAPWSSCSAFTDRTVWIVILALAFLGWTQIARVMRGAVITIKQADYVLAARALGAGTSRILFRHILPNAIAPVIVVATIALGVLHLGRGDPVVPGSGARRPDDLLGCATSPPAPAQIRVAPHILLFPSIMLSITVLAFIMLGDAVRDALDPKLR